jgi:hypothetical protein
MASIQNKTFDEIRLGDTASVQRTLQARDIRAWATAFGDVGQLAEAGDVQDAAGIITAILTSLIGSALPGPGSSIRSTLMPRWTRRRRGPSTYPRRWRARRTCWSYPISKPAT